MWNNRSIGVCLFQGRNTPQLLRKNCFNRPNINFTKYISQRQNSTLVKTPVDVKVFTPLSFSRKELADQLRTNLNVFSKSDDFDYSNLLNHVRYLKEYNSEIDGIVNAGALVQINTTDSIRTFGIVLDDYGLGLSESLPRRVVLSTGEIYEISEADILFSIPDFINKNALEDLLTDDLTLIEEAVKPLAETLTIFMLHFVEIVDSILSRDLIRTIYLKLAFTNYQSSLNISEFASQLYDESKPLRNLMNMKHNPFSFYVLIMSCHYLIFNDPIHFRKVTLKPSIFNALNPLSQITTSYFKNPLILSQNIENIFNQSNELIIKSYYGIMSRQDNFQIYNILKSDENFKRLMMLVKYSIVNPNPKLLYKLKDLLPIEEPLSPQVLFDFLVRIGVYDDNTNPLLASGVYGMNVKEHDDISVAPNNINDLQYSLNREIKLEKLPKNLSRFNPFKNTAHNGEGKKITSKYTREFLNMIHDAKNNIWKTKATNRTKLYKLTNHIAFSVEQINMTKNQFSFLIPIPNQSPNENITLQEPIQVTNNLKSYPNANKLNQGLREDQPCIKLTLVHNLIDKDSLTDPKITIGLDMFKKIEKIDDEWFNNRNALHLNNSKKKADCWLALNKLSNLIHEKEKSRIRLGYLKTFGDEREKSFENFKNFFNDNLKEATPELTRQFDYYEDKAWLIENLKYLIDENVGRFCFEKKINVANRSITKVVSKSREYKIFKKFKIFKWYADSYDTFNFQLSTNPGDLTAYANCLKFLGKPKVTFNRMRPSETEYQPLGLKYFTSFTRYEFMETHLNQWQLFRYLMINSFKLIKDKEMTIWDPKKLDVVTFEHYKKYLSQSEGYLELISCMNRVEALKKIKGEVSGGTNYEIIRCIVTKISKDTIYGYWLDMDIEVEIETNKNVSIGDRLLCSEVVLADVLTDQCIVR